jgi:hypothetical protein
MAYVTPGHPVKDGAGYDCHCGECLYQRTQRGEAENPESNKI